MIYSPLLWYIKAWVLPFESLICLRELLCEPSRPSTSPFAPWRCQRGQSSLKYINKALIDYWHFLSTEIPSATNIRWNFLNQITVSDLTSTECFMGQLVEQLFHFFYMKWMKTSVDPDQLASDEASWSGSTLFSKGVYGVWVLYGAAFIVNSVEQLFPFFIWIHVMDENQRRSWSAGLLSQLIRIYTVFKGGIKLRRLLIKNYKKKLRRLMPTVHLHTIHI